MENPATQPEPITEEQAFRLLADDGTIVTVNRRLARYLAGRFAEAQLASGKTVWETPDIVPYSAWLKRGYDQAAYSGVGDAPVRRRMLLSPGQELRVWEQIIYGSSYGSALLQVPEAAKTAREAWEICMAWRLPFDEISHAPAEDTQAFLNWADEFKKQCDQKGWLDNGSLEDFISDLFSSAVLKPPGSLILAGFDELTPRQISLTVVMASSGCRIYSLETCAPEASAVRCGFSDAETEMTAAARWARRRMAANPAGRIGVIVPALESLRESLIRTFDDVFHPRLLFAPPGSGNRLYNISLGKPLSAYPVIRAGLLFLRSAVNPLSVDEYSAFLRSPFLAGGETELSERAVLEARIRSHGEVALTVKDLLYRCSGRDRRSRACPVLGMTLKGFLRLSQALPGRQSPSRWAADFSGLLEALGWPGQRPLNSDEHQTVSAWQDALYRFSAMDVIVGETDFTTAVDGLRRICDETVFQPETGDVPVQIMGMLEAAGQRFDHLWIMGMQGEAWPASPRPNPLIPITLQRRFNLPHASPEREFAFARRVTLRLLASADEVIASYPLTDGESDLYPSPLIAALPEKGFDEQPPYPCFGFWLDIAKSGRFEQISDQKGPEIPEDSPIRGGTGLLKAQAACPFSAYAAYRLRAEPLETPEPGLNARERGSLVHSALERLWESLKSSKKLAAASEKDLEKKIEAAVSHAVSGMATRFPKKLTRRFIALEKQRLCFLLREWLEIEKQRSPFAVAGHEKFMPCSIGGISLKTFADRIDRTDDGRLVIIDYKTGEVSVREWFAERIAEPQLPLYCLCVDEPAAAVLFARVKKGDSRYFGIAENGGIAPGVRGIAEAGGQMASYTTVQEVIHDWKVKLESLAVEVREGHAAVAPVSVRTSCRYCKLGILCRVNEADTLKEDREAVDEP